MMKLKEKKPLVGIAYAHFFISFILLFFMETKQQKAISGGILCPTFYKC